MEHRSSQRKNIKQHLFKLLNHQVLPIDLVAVIAGDRQLSMDEQQKVKRLRKRLGKKLYTHLLYALTQKVYEPQMAKGIWKQILLHKEKLSQSLSRNVGVVVATLDYMGNVKNELHNPMIIDASTLSIIAEVAVKDGLTQLFDASTFHDKLKSEILRYKRYKNEVSLIMMDIDNFKHFNDTYGHQMGDDVLVQVAALVEDATRDLDICARYGGEEFAVILPQTEIDLAQTIAERIRYRIEKQVDAPETVTVSLGVSNCPSHAKAAKTLIKAADHALYASKEAGKNQVTLFHK